MARDDETREVPAADSHPAADARDEEPRLPGLLLTPPGADDEVDLTDEPEESLWQRPWFRATLVGVGVVVLGVGAIFVPSLIGGGPSTPAPTASAPPAVAGSAGPATASPQSDARAQVGPAAATAPMAASSGNPPAAAPSAAAAAVATLPAPATPPPARPPVAAVGEKATARAEALPAALSPRPIHAEKVAGRAASSSPAAGRFWVQVGAFKDRHRAFRLITHLARKGHTGVVVEGASADAPHVVRVGAYVTRQRAKDVQATLRREGLDGFLVKSAGS